MNPESVPSVAALDPSQTKVPLPTQIRELFREVARRLRRQYFIHVWHMHLGEGSVVSFKANLDKTNPRGIHVGQYSVVAFGAAVLTYDPVNRRNLDVHIGDNCLIGAHAVISPGVTIGDQCIVAAGCVVTRNIPSCTLVAGNPARVVEKGIRTDHWGVRIRT
jgi:acetyltransferase-like isoleucine patch superfamily enzyme